MFGEFDVRQARDRGVYSLGKQVAMTAALPLFLSLSACQHSPAQESAAAPALKVDARVPQFKKVVLLLFENEDFDRPISHPFFSEMAKKGALLTNYHAVAHPSEPNYIALTSGDTQGVTDDADHDLPGKHLGDLLEERGKTWKNYAENFPGNCFRGAFRGKYARKHTPFISYTNVSQSARCSRIVDASEFESDVKKNQLPDFSFYTPNMDNDAHDTDIGTADRWFKNTFEPLLDLPGFKDVVLIVTFDENECNTIGPWVASAKVASCKGDTNQVYTIFYGAGVMRGVRSRFFANHYSLLKTIEAGFGLGSLGKQDEDAEVISGIWTGIAR